MTKRQLIKWLEAKREAYECKENWDKYGKAIEKFPNVLWTHTADMMAARIKGI